MSAILLMDEAASAAGEKEDEERAPEVVLVDHLTEYYMARSLREVRSAGAVGARARCFLRLLEAYEKKVDVREGESVVEYTRRHFKVVVTEMCRRLPVPSDTPP